MRANNDHIRNENGFPAADKPALEWVFSIKVEVSPPVEQGDIRGATTRFIPIVGGVVSGPQLRGRVLNGGGDWQSIHPGGVTEIEARYFVEAEDGTVIEIHNPGLRIADEETIGALTRGEAVAADKYYFRTQPRFRVAAGQHDWLNRTTFIARGVRLPDQVIVDYYAVR